MVAKVLGISPSSGYELMHEPSFPILRIGNRMVVVNAAIRSGDDIKSVQGNLGYATASFTLDKYGHVTEQMKRASADRMQQYIDRIKKTG